MVYKTVSVYPLTQNTTTSRTSSQVPLLMRNKANAEMIYDVKHRVYYSHSNQQSAQQQDTS